MLVAGADVEAVGAATGLGGGGEGEGVGEAKGGGGATEAVAEAVQQRGPSLKCSTASLLIVVFMIHFVFMRRA